MKHGGCGRLRLILAMQKIPMTDNAAWVEVYFGAGRGIAKGCVLCDGLGAGGGSGCAPHFRVAFECDGGAAQCLVDISLAMGEAD